MEQIIKTCTDILDNDYLKDQFRWQTGMKEELERLRENYPKIQAVLDFASSQPKIGGHNNTAFNKCIWQLRDAIDEAADVLDELEYMKLKEQITKNTEETKKRKFTSFISESFRKIRKIGKRALKIDPNLTRLEEAVQNLDKVSADVTFLQLVDGAKQEQKEQEVDFYKERETGALPTTNDLIGRGEAMEYVTQWLKKLSNEHRDRNISLLSIVGHGGMGKTTLLQHVYEEDEITEEFDLKMWVCVSNNFDVKKVIVDMLECLEVKKRPRMKDSFNTLLNNLRTEIMSKKFLLILDDIWEEEEENLDISKWEKVFAPLTDGKIGSGILLTTRMDSVATMLAKVIKTKKETFKLKGLEEDMCLQLLNSHAFAGVENPTDDHKKLRAIAGEIVKKLLGSPLAAKVIGGLLSFNLNERYWMTVLESNLLGQNSVDSILRLSYVVLSKPLKCCFAFCCGMFTQDHKYDKDDLIRMWIALGFIQPSQGMTMEDIGERYFDVLVKKTLLEKVGDDYKMHDLIHESASKFFAPEYGQLMDDEESSLKISETIRHFSITTTNPNIIQKIGQFKYLHSLFLFHDASNQDLYNALIKIFKASRSLRLLYIWAPYDFETIPKEIENLIHLRYLKIEVYNLTMLPRSVSNLYHLQYIIYDGSESKGDDFLPSDINNLSNLRYMKLPKNCISSICGIGKLNSLQELDRFDVSDVSGYRIGELENMNDLCKLGINCLKNVKVSEEACSAKLYAKRRLTDLTLCWSNTCLEDNIDFDDFDYSYENDFDVLYENVLDNLQPPECLMNLSINNYRGTRSPIWMNKMNPISNLEKIELSDCRQWETLPPFGKLRFLKSLKLFWMLKVKWLESKFNGNDKYHAFPSLEVLHISYLDALEDWFEAGVAAEDGCLFPCLIELKLFSCRKLKELPSLPSKLKSLQIRSTGWKTLNFCSNSNPIPLETLEVFGCPNITSRPLADEIARLISLGRYREVNPISNLEEIELSDCLECETLPPFGQLPFLKSLTLSNMPKVKWLESKFTGNDKYRAFPMLEVLYIRGLEALEDWFEAGVAAEDGCLFPCLIELEIENCPKLKESPSLPSKLKRLKIKNMDWKTLNFCSNSNPIPLETLEVFRCPSITSLPLADEIARLAALRNLTITDCPNLRSLGNYPEVGTSNNCHLMLSDLDISDPSVLLMEPLRSIASLKTLSIKFNDKLVSFPNEAEQWFLNVRSSLSELKFVFLKSLESLPSSLESLSSLEYLSIQNVPKLWELPNLPPSLKRLSIWKCPELKKRYREDGGSDRHKIAHIPHINFYA